MQLIFTKGAGKFDQMVVIREDGPSERVECPKQGIIPHDMVHYAVESVLRKRGFVTRLAAGETLDYRMGAEPESDGVERLVEVFQADGWAGWSSAPADMLDLYQVTCRARQCEALAVDEQDVEAVRACILALTARWQATGVGQSVALAF
jgi:hypothetical protein